MSDERLQILQMVQEGKVSAEEATRLLDALGHGLRPGNAPRATRVRIHVAEGRKLLTLSLGVGLARWALSLPMIRLDVGGAPFDADRLAQLIGSGTTGKVLEFTEENKRLEVWLDP